MRSRLVSVPHSVRPDELVFEIWYRDEFIGTITGSEGPSIKIHTKHNLVAKPDPANLPGDKVVNVLHIMINPSGDFHG